MRGRIAALGHFAGREAAALIDEGQLDDFLLAPPETLPAPGTIFRATADRPMKGQGGITVKLPGGDRGYLRKIKGIAPGSSLLVQVTGFAEEGKAVPVTDQILFKSRYAIVTPGKPGRNVSRAIRDDDRRDVLLALADGFDLPEGAGLILRSLAEFADDDAVSGDIAAMSAAASEVLGVAQDGAPRMLAPGPGPHDLARRDWTEVSAIERGADALEKTGALALVGALSIPKVPLPNGAHLFIEETRAMVAVDVNTGADTSLAAGLKANIAAARALPAQLRARGLGGQIVIDLAPCPKKNRRQVEQALDRAFKADPIETALAGWTPLGHFELQRKRERLPLSRSQP